jgi:hypothetical protein
MYSESHNANIYGLPKTRRRMLAASTRCRWTRPLLFHTSTRRHEEDAATKAPERPGN